MSREQRTKAALAEIETERERQVAVEGWTEAHDDAHNGGEMAEAAAAYALGPSVVNWDGSSEPPPWWPWDKKWWKPGDRRRDLVKAGALIVAELERLGRLAGEPGTAE